MATKSAKTKIKPEVKAVVKEDECCGSCRNYDSKWVSVGWVLLLLGGLAHMLPEQMAPVLKWSVWGVSAQLVIGVVSVILALNFLLDEE
ncbi:MAG: hypothetical protein A2184_02115 [Candidatus Moranbacteria bacterium RIFOXYA1_FULL_44_7]|nr:MAG: hypothetical protein A2184_02115 [Candidatus Moranbacteria bacterium RIFOXYA1_FULL_44_7]